MKKISAFPFILLWLLLGQLSAQASDLTECFKAFTNIGELTAQTQSRVLGLSEFKGFEGEPQKFNELFIMAARGRDFSNTRFLRLENKMMKLLNDVILKNKGDSYSVSIGFQTLFLDNLKRNYPHLHGKIKLQYHDYKSLNLGFEEPVNIQDLQIAFRETQQEFATVLERDLRERGINIPDRYQDFQKWFVGTMGETPDQASLAAKFARSENSSRLVSFAEKEADIRRAIAQKNDNWNYVKNSLKGEKFYQVHLVEGAGRETLNLDIVNIARKADGKEAFIRELKGVYPEIEPATASAIYDYIDSIDKLTASVLTPSTTSISPNETTGIVFSVDIGQMGAEGFVETMKRVNHLTDMNAVMREAREAFWQADRKLNSFYEHVKSSFTGDVDADLIQRISHTSGDDALFVFDDAINSLKRKRKDMLEAGASPEEIEQINKRITRNESKWGEYREEGFDNYLSRASEHPEAYRLRVTSVKPVYKSTGHDIPRKDVSTHIERAESAEKHIRKNFLKHPDVGVDESKKIVVGIETEVVDEGHVQHRLVVVNNSSVAQKKLEEAIYNQYQSYIGGLKDLKFTYLEPQFNFIP